MLIAASNVWKREIADLEAMFAGSPVFSTQVFAIPSFPTNDMPTLPETTYGSVENWVPVDRDGNPRLVCVRASEQVNNTSRYTQSVHARTVNARAPFLSSSPSCRATTPIIRRLRARSSPVRTPQAAGLGTNEPELAPARQ